MKKQGLLAFTFTLSITVSALSDSPKLVSTTPVFWSVGINAATQKTASLTFDQPMRSGFWDWFGRDVLSPDSSLHTTMSPDGTTVSVDIKVAPGKVYIMGLNEKGLPGVGFQNAKGFSLPPTYLVFQTAGTAAPEDAPPRVKGIVPANGTQQIDSTRIRAIVITFDQPMGTKKHGLHLFENDNPVDISKLPFGYSPDGKTFTLSYNFKPATRYRMELNSVTDIGFSRANRVPLWPVRIAFTTG